MEGEPGWPVVGTGSQEAQEAGSGKMLPPTGVCSCKMELVWGRGGRGLHQATPGRPVGAVEEPAWGHWEGTHWKLWEDSPPSGSLPPHLLLCWQDFGQLLSRFPQGSSPAALEPLLVSSDLLIPFGVFKMEVSAHS